MVCFTQYFNARFFGMLKIVKKNTLGKSAGLQRAPGRYEHWGKTAYEINKRRALLQATTLGQLSYRGAVFDT